MLGRCVRQLLLLNVGQTERQVGQGVLRVEFHCAGSLVEHLPCDCGRIIRPHARELMEAADRETLIRSCEGWLKLDGLTKIVLRLNEMFAVVLKNVPHTALIEFPRAQILRLPAARAITLGRADLWVQSARDAVSDLALERENVSDWPVI